MTQASFRFQQFEVFHDRCAMKVGTDGVLLGAWADVEHCRRMLDIGTGTGIIALMVAQRAPEAEVVAVEIDGSAAIQARENVSRSPFADRIRVVQADVRTFHDEGGPFDCILCNPPFFSEDTLPGNRSRSLARHNAHLRFEELIAAVEQLLSPSGLFHVVLPQSEVNTFVSTCFISGLNLVRQCQVKTVESKPPKRALLTFSPCGKVCTQTETLVLQHPDGSRTTAYDALTHDFYLW